MKFNKFEYLYRDFTKKKKKLEKNAFPGFDIQVA